MKCIQMCGQDGKIKRINDADAIDLVFHKKAKFISKEAYKAAEGKGPAYTSPRSNSKNQNKKNSEKSKKDMIKE